MWQDRPSPPSTLDDERDLPWDFTGLTGAPSPAPTEPAWDFTGLLAPKGRRPYASMADEMSLKPSAAAGLQGTAAVPGGFGFAGTEPIAPAEPMRTPILSPQDLEPRVAARQAPPPAARPPRESGEQTPLSPAQELDFRRWAAASGITDVDHPDSHYDYRGLFLAVGGKAIPPAPDRHFPDTFKQHGHPTFSVESRYSQGPNDGGRWEGGRFVPPTVVGPSIDEVAGAIRDARAHALETGQKLSPNELAAEVSQRTQATTTPPATGPLPYARPHAPVLRSRTGTLYQTPEMGTNPVLDAPHIGAQQIAAGVRQIARAATDTTPVTPSREPLRRARTGALYQSPPPIDPRTKAGAADILEGAMTAATPLVIGEGLAAPKAVVSAVVKAVAAAKATEKVLESAGATPEDARLASDLVGAVAAGVPLTEIARKGVWTAADRLRAAADQKVAARDASRWITPEPTDIPVTPGGDARGAATAPSPSPVALGRTPVTSTRERPARAPEVVDPTTSAPGPATPPTAPANEKAAPATPLDHEIDTFIRQVAPEAAASSTPAVQSAERASESKASVIRTRTDITGSSHGQQDGHVVALDAEDRSVGRLDFTEHGGEVHVRMVDVDPALRRRGIATQMLEQLRQDYGADTPIRQMGDITTPEGRAFAAARGILPPARTLDDEINAVLKEHADGRPPGNGAREVGTKTPGSGEGDPVVSGQSRYTAEPERSGGASPSPPGAFSTVAPTTAVVKGDTPPRSERGKPAVLTLHERRELRRMLAEMETLEFTRRTFNDPGVGKGGNPEVVGGGAGAPVFHDIRGNTRVQVTQAIRRVLEGKPPTSVGSRAIAVARGRLAGDPHLSAPMLPPDAGDEPGAIYVDRRTDLPADELAVHRAAAAALEAKPAEYVRQYRERFGNVVSADHAKELFPAYAASKEARSRFNSAVQQPASRLARAVYRQMLDETRDTPGLVVFTAGGTGSGKTSSLDLFPTLRHDAAIIYDSTLSDRGGAIQDIDAALGAGKQVGIVFTYRDVADAFTNGVLPRAMREGRTVTLPAHVATHARAPAVLRAIVERYGNRGEDVEILVVDNSHGPAERTVAPLSLAEGIRYDQADVRARLREALDAEHAAGRISDVVYHATRPAPERVAARAGREGSRAVATAPADAGAAAPSGRTGTAADHTEKGVGRPTPPFAPRPDASARPRSRRTPGSERSAIGPFDESDTPGSARVPGAPADLFREAAAPRTPTAHPIEFPELVDLARELIGTPDVVRRFRADGKLGEFRATKTGGSIRLASHLFKTGQEHQLARALAHEIGHLIDWLPSRTLKRGNLLGRLYSLRRYLKHTFTAADGSTIRNAEIREELRRVSDAWRPWNPAKASASFRQYRHSSEELYADALSVLLNNPALLQKQAPRFYAAFFDGLDRKPEVKTAYFDLQEVLSGTREELVARRRAGVRRMFEGGDTRAIDLEAQRQAERAESRKDIWFRLKVQLVDKNYAVIDRVTKLEREGTHLPEDEDPRYFLEERNYIGGQMKGWVQRHIEPLYRNLQDAGIDWHQFGEALFYERIIAGDRSEIANPRGLNPDAAHELHASLIAQLGPERARVLEDALTAFRRAIRGVADEAYQAGLYSAGLHHQMTTNPAYATFQVIEQLEKGVTSRVYQQVGTLKDITNPADATILKTLVTKRAIEYQTMKVATIRFLERHYPEDITPANEAKGARGAIPIASRNANEHLVTYFERGRLKGKYVDRYVADALNNESIGQNLAVISILRTMNSGLFRPLFTTLNVGFQTFNASRDFWRFWKNTPGMTLPRAVRRYWQSVPLAKVRAFGLAERPSAKEVRAFDDLLDAEERKILSITFNDLNAGRTLEDTQIEELLAQMGIGDFATPVTPSRRVVHRAWAGVTKPVRAVLDVIREAGDFVETLPKAAGMYEFRGAGTISDLTPAQRSFIRRKLGSPDFLAGGTAKPVTNEVFLFSNAITQAIRSDLEVATDPQTRSGFWWKTAKLNMLPKLLMAAALAGLFGDTLRRLMRRASEYDLTNYLVVPLGDNEHGNTAYLRVPVDDSGRFVGGLLWKALRLVKGDKDVLETLAQVVDYTAGQTPTVSPGITGVVAGAEVLGGRNPGDRFTGRNVFTDDEFAARDSHTAKKFLGWEFQQLGGGVVWKFYPGDERPRAKSAGQQLLELPILSNILGRWIKISNRGETESLQDVRTDVQRDEARHRLSERAALNDALREYTQLPRAEQTPARRLALLREIVRSVYADRPIEEQYAKAEDLVKKFAMGLLRGEADPLTEVVLSSTSNAQKAVVILKAQEEMPAADFRAWWQSAVAHDLISEDLALRIVAERRRRNAGTPVTPSPAQRVIGRPPITGAQGLR